MKKALLIVGIVLILYALYSLFPYITDFSQLSKYGKGYIVGKFLFLFIGILLAYLGIRKKK